MGRELPADEREAHRVEENPLVPQPPQGAQRHAHTHAVLGALAGERILLEHRPRRVDDTAALLDHRKR